MFSQSDQVRQKMMAVRAISISTLGAVAAMVLASCGGTSVDNKAVERSNADVPEVEAPVKETARPFSCPATEEQIARISDLDLEHERGTDASLNTPAEALRREPVIDVLLCSFVSPQELGPAMVHIHWTEFPGRVDAYHVVEHSEWGEESFVMHPADDPSTVVARLGYPGGGYWSVTVLVPGDVTSDPGTALRLAEGLGDLIASEAESAATTAGGTADVDETALRQHLGEVLPERCPDVDQFVHGGGRLGASGDEMSVDGMPCDLLLDLIRQISPALDDDSWRDRISTPRLDGVGALTCYLSEAAPDGGVPIFCDDGRATRASLTLVSSPE